MRFGMIHRNTYVNAPAALEPTFETRRRPGLFFAGQMSGVEGYVESAASGLLAGIGAAFRARGEEPLAFPERHGARRPGPLHRPQRPRGLPADQHRLRPAARAARSGSATRPGGAWPSSERALDSLERFRGLRGPSGAPRGAPAATRWPSHAGRSMKQASRRLPPPPRPGAQRLAPHGPGLRRRSRSSSPPTLREELGREPRAAGRRPPAHPRLPGRPPPARPEEGLGGAQARRAADLLPLPLPGGRARPQPRPTPPVSPRSSAAFPRIWTRPRSRRFLDVPGGTRSRPCGPARSWSCSTRTGIRCAELVGLDLAEVDLDARHGPRPGEGAQGADRALRDAGPRSAPSSTCPPGRERGPGSDALFVNARGGRLTDRSVRKLVDEPRQASWLWLARSVPTPSGTASPPTCWTAGRISGPFRSFWAMRSLSTTQRYTHVDTRHILEIYRKTHPRA